MPSDAEHAGPARPGPWLLPVIAFLVQLPGLAFAHHRPLVTAVTLLALASPPALLFARRWPGPSLIAIALLCAPAIAFGQGPPLAAVPVAMAVFLGIVRGARGWVWSTLAGLAVVGPSVVVIVQAVAVQAVPMAGQGVSLVRPLAVALALSLLVGLAEMARGRRERFRELSRQIAARRRSEAEAERIRIARELHDVLAHSLSQISVQAGVGLHLFDTRPESARASLAAIKSTSAQALEEVRGVLGFLRDEGSTAPRAPGPGLERVPALVDTFTRAGLDVTVSDELDANVPAAVQLALYRIVQEALTNVSRHAAAAHVEVRLHADARDYLLSVADDGPGAAGVVRPGRGLLGMRERAELLGGDFRAGRMPTGGFRVDARIPRQGEPE